MFGCFFFQAEDGIRDLVRSRGLGDVYKRQVEGLMVADASAIPTNLGVNPQHTIMALAGLYAELSLIHI